MENYQYTPRFKYTVQKTSAKKRGIGFLLTFEQWWGIWEPHWDKRGRAGTNLVMCRVADKGNYEFGNIFIDTCGRNNNHLRRHPEDIGELL